MQRREFSKKLIVAGASSGLLPLTINSSKQVLKPQKILPKALKQGDTVGIVAPASPFPPERIPLTESNMKSLGLQVKWSRNLQAKNGYLAGKDKQRLRDIHKMFKDPEIKAIWCIRGGYGSTRLLPDLDFDLIRSNPKILIGYSDITALLNAIYQKTGLVCFHGPVGSSTFSEYTITKVKQTLFDPLEYQRIERAPNHMNSETQWYTPFTIRKGRAEGELVGGNLSLLAATCGSPHQIEVKNKLIFIEDIGEKPYRIDRMLTQLRQTLPLEDATGIILGIFEDCQPGEKDVSLSLSETLTDRLRDLKVPVAYGFSFGHITDQCTFPIGAKARIDTNKMLVEIMEPVVQV